MYLRYSMRGARSRGGLLEIQIALHTLAHRATASVGHAALRLSAAQTWLQQWIAEHEGTLQYHGPVRKPAEIGTSARGRSRIPTLILMTVRSVDEAIAGHGDSMATWWTLNPTHSFVLLSDDDCRAFIKVCCSRDEQLAYTLLKHGPQRADLFRAIFMREVGGIYIDQDSTLKQPLHSFMPPWASIVTGANQPVNQSFRTAWTFNFLAFAPGCPIWEHAVQHVTRRVIEQARWACLKDKMGCRGFMNCVQNITGTRPYQRAVEAITRRYGCRSMADCQNATHPMLRRLHVVPPAELPYEHTPCHAKRTGKHHVQTLCMRSNDSKPHYVSLPEAAYSFYKANPRGKRLHSSAPGFFQSHCDGAVPSGANDRNPGKLSTGWWTRT